MSMDLHGLVAPFALDALDELERARFLAHLDDCEQCSIELSGYVETAAILGAAEATPPPPALRAQLMSTIAVTPQQRMIQAPPKWRMRLVRGSMAAAVLLGVAGVGGYVMEHQRAQDIQSTNVAMSTVLGAPDAQTLTKNFEDGGNVRLVVSAEHDSAVVVANALPAPADGKVYQVWMIGEKGPHSEGTFTTEGTMVMKGVVGASAVAVTVEPAGGSDKPTTTPIATLPV